MPDKKSPLMTYMPFLLTIPFRERTAVIALISLIDYLSAIEKLPPDLNELDNYLYERAPNAFKFGHALNMWVESDGEVLDTTDLDNALLEINEICKDIYHN